jgi:hypothetical protein
MEYNVYAAYSAASECLYIGSGLKDRYKHVVSGCSHVYELNRLHFEGVHVDVKVLVEFDNKQDSLDYEKQLIMSESPKFNITHNSTFYTPSKVKSPALSIDIPNLISNFLREKGTSKRNEKYCAQTLRALFQYIKPISLFKVVHLPRLEKDTEKGAVYAKIRRAVREKGTFAEGNSRLTLSSIIYSSSATSIKFTEEFVQFCNKTKETGKVLDL